VNISGRVKDLLDLKGVKQVMLTYSHDEGYAVAQVVLVGDGQRADERHE
jgi:phosphopantetheinyl transferase (holo-ACP synthase)